MPERWRPTCAARLSARSANLPPPGCLARGRPLKVLSRVASPAGFVLVLLLFFLLPFVSVSCDVPDYGDAGVSYTGSHLVSGAKPEMPAELQELARDPETPVELVEPPDPNVQVLAIVLAVLAAVGVLTLLVPQVKARLLGGAVAAAATLFVTVITMAVAQSNIKSAMLDAVTRSGVAKDGNMQRFTDAADKLTHTEVGFWLMVVLLALITVVSGTLGLFGDRLRAARSHESAGEDGLDGLPFEVSEAAGRGQPPPDA
jgi:hypothetical protein